MHFNWFGLSVLLLLEKTIDKFMKDYRKWLQHVCQPTMDILNITHITDCKLLYLIKYHLM